MSEANKKPALYEKWLSRLLNHKWIAGAMVLGIFVIAIDNFFISALSVVEKVTPKQPKWELPPHRTNYFNIRGIGVSLLLQGYLDPLLQNRLNGSPLVIQNDVFQELRRLTKYSAPVGHSHDEFYFSIDGEMQSPRGEKADPEEQTHTNKNRLPRNIPVIPGAFWLDELNIEWIDLQKKLPNLQKEFSKRWHPFLVNSSEDAPGSNVFLKELESAKIEATRLHFYAELTRDEALAIIRDQKVRDFYFDISKQGIPNGFFMALLSYDECSHGGWYVQLIPPALQIKVMVIEGVTKEAMSVGPIRATISDFNAPTENGTTQGTKLPAQPVQELPIEVVSILPTERLIVPLGLEFTFDRDLIYLDDDQKNTERVDLKEVSSLLKGKTKVILYEQEREPETEEGDVTPSKKVKANTPPTTFAEYDTTTFLSNFGPFEFPQGKLFKYGRQVDVREISVNGKWRKVRSSDIGGLIVSYGVAEGSCPYLTCLDESKKPLFEGKVLTGYTTPNVSRDYWIKVPADSRAITLDERDPETTFIKAIYYQIGENPGSKVTLFNGSKVLERGDHMNFTLPPNSTGDDCWICVRGYYIPH